MKTDAKIDVAAQSFGKPELMFYALLTLRQHSGYLVDTVYINDEMSDHDTLAFYNSKTFLSALSGWRVRICSGRRGSGERRPLAPGFMPSGRTSGNALFRGLAYLLQTMSLFSGKTDIRYQRAIDSTDKDYLFLMHDSMEFRDDVPGRYLTCMKAMDKPGITGELGQCWQCGYHADPECYCSPRAILSGSRPQPDWPLTSSANTAARRNCRINEWCALLSVRAAKAIAEKEHSLFGDCDDCGDIGAYWFHMAVKNGYEFADPFPEQEQRDRNYKHCWQEMPGRAVRGERSKGKSACSRELIKKRIAEKYGIVV
ncbi:MAG: hypothetical protein PHW69_04025 [Elusimicrobiaceae bacterium]|nr:hypothetical protein [Elusimicrobiaceae bacterium]